MKKEELFKNMSNIDDDLIDEANGLRGKDGAVSPIMITEGKRRFNFKPVAAAACCIILAGAVTAVGIKYGGSLRSEQPQSSGIENITEQTGVETAITSENPSAPGEVGTVTNNPAAPAYPAAARYQYKGDYSELTDFGGVLCLEFAEAFYTYRDLAGGSDIVVAGQFIDDPYQDIDPDDTSEVYPLDFQSYNLFKVDKVLGGNVSEGDEIVIAQSYAVKWGSVLSNSKLTPMLKGDRWVYFLSYNENNGTYYPVNDYMGRFPDPSAETGNRVLPAMTNKYGLTDGSEFNTNIYGILEQKLCPETIPAVECVYDVSDPELNMAYYMSSKYGYAEFEMAEFENYLFTVDEGLLSADNPAGSVTLAITGSIEVNGAMMSSNVADKLTLDRIFLTDLNGDGKREICIEMERKIQNYELQELSWESFVLVYDIVNGITCPLNGEYGEYEYCLAERDGELIAYKTQHTTDSSRGEVISDEPLHSCPEVMACYGHGDTHHTEDTEHHEEEPEHHEEETEHHTETTTHHTEEPEHHEDDHSNHH